MSKKIILIDGHSIINRAFYGVPALTNAQGTHTNGIYGFFNIMLKLMDEEKPQYLAVAFDLKAPTFRHKLYDAYKGTRKGMPEELHEQVPLLKELLSACGIPVLTMEGYEADDILGTVARQCAEAGMEVILLSGDRDLLQLAGERIRICLPRTKGGMAVTEMFGADEVKASFGVSPKEFIEMKALMGDSSDNIPGVPGIGPKTAASLIEKYHSVDGVYAHIDELKAGKARKSLEENEAGARLSRTLVEICTQVPLDFDLGTAGCEHIYTKKAYELMSRLELKSLMKRFAAEGLRDEAEADDKETGDGQPGSEQTESGKSVEIIRVSDEDTISCMKEKLLSSRAIAIYRPDSENICAFCCNPGEIWQVDLIAPGAAALLMQLLVALACDGRRLIAHDWKKLLKVLPVREYEGCVDLSLAAYLLNPLQSNYEPADIASSCLGITLYPQDEERLPSLLLQCAPVLLDSLEKAGMLSLYREIEMPLLFSLDRMEKAGIGVEKEALAVYGNSLTDGITRLAGEIYELAGHEFNILSPKQLGVILFEELQLPYGKKTKTGYSTSADVLDKLRCVHPIVDKVLSYRTLTKLKSTYADGLAAFISEDGRIHGRFNQTVTATGRISSADPNLQNIPVRMELGRAIRKVFVPAEGCMFMDADYSQIELRLLAHMSGDANLIEAYHKARDIHAGTASEVFHVPLEEVTPEQRRNAKAVNFGIVYGISAFGLSEDLSISRQEADSYIKKYFEVYPGVKVYLDGQVAFCRENGYVETLCGRRRPVPEIKASNFMQRSFGERVAMNSPIQGTAADVMKIAMIRTDCALREQGLRARIILQVHDELLIELPKEEEAAVREILEREMKGAMSLSVPLEIEIGTGMNWYETK